MIEPQRPVDFCGLAIIGEAPGADEITQGLPFVGKAGKFLNTVLADVGIDRSRCLVTNVFLERPENNKIDQFFRLVQEEDDAFIGQYGLLRDRVVRDQHRPEMARLDRELAEWQPRILLLLGATALWRITRQNGITQARGSWTLCQMNGIGHLVGIMPTWHPSAVARDRNRKTPEFVADLNQVKEVLDGIDAEVD